MRLPLALLAGITLLSAQVADAPPEDVALLVGRLELDLYKSHIRALTQFGDRRVGTQRNRDAIDWLERKLRTLGYANVERHQFMERGDLLENIYATKVGTSKPEEMYIISAHMDGMGGGEAADDDASGCAVVLELARVLGMPGVQTERSVRLVFWNGEEIGLTGSTAYVRDRARLQGTAAEPIWLGMIQHDMVLFDHGMPPGSQQRAAANLNVEYQERSKRSAESAELAKAFQVSSLSFGRQSYQASIGKNMIATDSHPFQEWVAAVSVRENERLTEIGRGSNPHWHQTTDRYETYGVEDFRLGLEAARMTLGALGKLVGISVLEQATAQ